MKDKTQQMTDHDLIIRLDTKMDQLSLDIKKVSDGTSLKLGEHEVRIKDIEKIHNEIDPLGTFKQIQAIAEEQHDFKLLWKYVILVAVFLSSAITFVLTSAFQLMHIFGVK